MIKTLLASSVAVAAAAADFDILSTTNHTILSNNVFDKSTGEKFDFNIFVLEGTDASVLQFSTAKKLRCPKTIEINDAKFTLDHTIEGVEVIPTKGLFKHGEKPTIKVTNSCGTIKNVPVTTEDVSKSVRILNFSSHPYASATSDKTGLFAVHGLNFLAGGGKWFKGYALNLIGFHKSQNDNLEYGFCQNVRSGLDVASKVSGTHSWNEYKLNIFNLPEHSTYFNDKYAPLSGKTDGKDNLSVLTVKRTEDLHVDWYDEIAYVFNADCFLKKQGSADNTYYANSINIKSTAAWADAKRKRGGNDNVSFNAAAEEEEEEDNFRF